MMMELLRKGLLVFSFPVKNSWRHLWDFSEDSGLQWQGAGHEVTFSPRDQGPEVAFKISSNDLRT